MNEIQSGRFNAILHKLLDMKEGAPAPTLAPEVIATLQLAGTENDWAFLQGTRLCGAASVQAAGGAGLFGQAILENPAGSNVLIVVKEVWLANDSATANVTFRIAIGTPPTYDASANGLTLDTRFAGQTSAAVVGELAAAAATGTLFGIVRSAANESLQKYSPPVVLAPGSQFVVRHGSANVAWNVTFLWSERVLEASETR